jgi:hypothetical protein
MAIEHDTKEWNLIISLDNDVIKFKCTNLITKEYYKDSFVLEDIYAKHTNLLHNAELLKLFMKFKPRIVKTMINNVFIEFNCAVRCGKRVCRERLKFLLHKKK